MALTVEDFHRLAGKARKPREIDRLPKPSKPKELSADAFHRLAGTVSKKPKPVSRIEPKEEFDPFTTEGARHFEREFAGSSLGQMFGMQPRDGGAGEGFGAGLAGMLGGFVGDLPAMVAGGAVAGIPGAFAAPELLKQIVEYKGKPSRDSLIKSIGDIAQIPFETAKQALVGAATGKLGQLAAMGKVFPGSAKLLGSRTGQELLRTGGELLGMTGGQAVVSGELPTAKELGQQAVFLGGVKGAGAITGKVGKAIGKKLPLLSETAFVKMAKELKPVKKAIEKFEKSKPYYEKVRKLIGKKDAAIVEGNFKWDKKLAKAEAKGKFTPNQLKEATYYTQRTANPEIKGDTYRALSSRMPNSLKRLINKEVKPHLRKTLKTINELPYTKKINPREYVLDNYLPGVYENTGNFREVLQKVGKEFKFKSMFADQKTFLNYNEALVKAGLKPRYNNPIDLIRHMDRVVEKGKAGAHLLSDIAKTEKESGKKLIVTSRDGEAAYRQAEAEGFKPYEDLTLRGYTPEGKLEKPTIKPALVAPEAAGALQGIFSKDAYRPRSKFWNTLENISDFYRLSRVRLSFFHYVPLTESALASLPTSKVANLKGLAKEGQTLRKDPAFMSDTARHGLKIHKPVERFQTAMKLSDKLADKAIKILPKRVVGIAKSKWNPVTRGLKLLAKSQNYLFEQYHPNLKAVTYNDFVNRIVEKASREGKKLSSKDMYKIKTQMADVVNNMYGGQNWKTQRLFNSAKYRNWLKGAIGYPDWTTSAIRQAADAFSGGLKGDASRRYWMKFGVNYLAFTGMMKFAAGGLYQSDKENKSVKGVRFDWKKGLKEITDPDPVEWHKFGLPDVPLKIAGHEFNPGRDERGRRLFTHPGKQALEIAGWRTSPAVTYFGKANPLVQMVWSQLVGSTPGKLANYSVRGKRKTGKKGKPVGPFLPWDATEPGTAARAVSRAASIAGGAVPFSVRAAYDKGLASYAATGLGSLPISLGATPHKAFPGLVKAFKKKDKVMIRRIKRALKDNGYKKKSINYVLQRAKNKSKEK